MQEKQFALAVFMDIQRAFDSTTFTAIQEALESRDVGRIASRWTVNMLKCWNIHLIYQGESIEARVVKGCPQGAVLPPLLRCMVVDSLLLKLNALGYTAQAYADELAIVTQGKNLNTIADLTQGSFRVVDSWCKTKGLPVNPEKTEVLLFTRKRKTEGVVKLEYQGVKLNLTKEVKYLGVILDDKLMWKAHVRTQVKKGLKALWSCNAYIGRTRGLSPKMALWLYTHVIIPKITYAAVAWWYGTDITLTRFGLERL